MKPYYKPLATALAATLQLAALAAVPLAWDVRPGQPAPVTFDRYHGEAIDFSATFRGFGDLPFAPGADIRLWYQTNGMGSAWWSVPATVQSNVLSATWSPALDPGADRVSLFFGAPSNAYAAAVLRLRHSPGFAPGAMPDPETFHESDPVFSEWLSTYTPPDTSLEPATNYTDRALSSFAATGTVARAFTYGTATRWTDATGCVWEASMSWKITPPTFPGADGYPEEYVGEPIYLYEDHSPGAWWSPRVGDDWLLGLGKGYSNSTELAWSVDVEAAIAITATRGLVTNLIGRIALTNDVPAASDRALSSFAATGTVARARSYGTPTRWTDVTGCVWEVVVSFGPWNMTAYSGWSEDDVGYWTGPYWWQDGDSDPEMHSGNGWYLEPVATPRCIGRDADATALDYSEGSDYVVHWERERITTTNLVGRVALTNDIPAAPDLSPIQQDIADLRTESALVYRLYSGSNVVAEVTNYNSQVHAPELRLMQLNESNEYVTVWTETNGLARTLKRANEYTDDATGAVARAAAPRAWGRTTSGLGADAPSNTTWISTEKLVIASGLEYVHIDSAGVWILCANGQVDFSTPTNSFFSISTDSGENVFSVERTDSRPIPVDCGGINVVDSGDNKVVTIPVPVFDATENANEPPFLNVGLDLKGPWYSETNGIPSTVVSSCTWSGQNGAWTNTIVLSASHPSAFFNYSKWQAGGTVIRNKAAMEVSGGVLCTDGIHKGRPVYNNGTIIWEVVP